MRAAAAVMAFMAMTFVASAQKYSGGVVDKTVAVVGNEVITISDIEEEVQVQMTGLSDIIRTMRRSSFFRDLWSRRVSYSSRKIRRASTR